MRVCLNFATTAKVGNVKLHFAPHKSVFFSWGARAKALCTQTGVLILSWLYVFHSSKTVKPFLRSCSYNNRSQVDSRSRSHTHTHTLGLDLAKCLSFSISSFFLQNEVISFFAYCYFSNPPLCVCVALLESGPGHLVLLLRVWCSSEAISHTSQPVLWLFPSRYPLTAFASDKTTALHFFCVETILPVVQIYLH